MEFLVAAGIVLGLIGVVVPVLPGLLLVSGSIGVWAWATRTWWLLAAVCVITVVVLVVKVVLPAHTARESASTWALAGGAVGGLIGFFAIPVVGMFIGFLAGVLATELVRLRAVRPALDATWATTKSLGISMALELVAALVLAGLWVAAVVAR
jgi:uncharacterized protein YqgC (DUF456 family)